METYLEKTDLEETDLEETDLDETDPNETDSKEQIQRKQIQMSMYSVNVLDRAKEGFQFWPFLPTKFVLQQEYSLQEWEGRGEEGGLRKMRRFLEYSKEV